MFEKAKPARDAFTFSLRGMAAKSPFVIAPIIADDRIEQVRDDRDRKPRGWLQSRRQTAQDCA